MANKQYRLYVGSSYWIEESGVRPSIWYKFLEHHNRPGTEDRINAILSEYNAKDDLNSLDLIFDSEEDAIIFKLKYG